MPCILVVRLFSFSMFDVHWFLALTTFVWSFDSIMQVVTFTSVGYGDLCPTTTAGKMFTILFGLSGIALLGAAIATIGSRLMEREAEMIRAAEKASRKRMFHLFRSIAKPNDNKKTANVATSEPATGNAPKPSLGVQKWRQTISNLFKRSIPAILALLFGGIIMGQIEGWSITDSLYYSFITAGTLGYGDFSPVTRRGRIWGIVFIPLAVAAAGELLGGVASALLERRQEEYYQSLMTRELDVKRLLEMDTDKDGRVSREEYVEFMLKEMDLVSETQFEELHRQFHHLDVDGGGFLDKNDIREKLNN